MEAVGPVGRRHQPCNCHPAARCSALLPATAVTTAARVEAFTSFNCPARRKQRTGTRIARAGIGGRCERFPPDSRARHSGRNDYNCHIGSAEWKRFRCEVTKQRGNRCERCGHVSAYLELHHKHYHSLGSEQPEDVELLCPKCHKAADEARAAKRRP